MEFSSRSKVLIVDDQPGNLVSMRAILDVGRYEVVTAESGEGALACVLSEEFACIILDVAMPGLDGFETARLIKERERSRTIPILFVTASVLDIDHVFEGYTVGAVDYLQKPVQSHALRAKVSVFVDLHEQSRALAHQAHELERAERRERDLLEERARREAAGRQRAVAALNVSEARFRALENSGLVGVVYFNLDGTITGANDAFWDLLGYREPQALSFFDIVPSEKGHQERDELAELKGSGLLPIVEKELLRADGQPVFALVGRALLHYDDGAEGLGFVVDRTTRKRIENERSRILGELRGAVRARDDFLSIAAHELRTPLTPLRLQLDGLQRLLPEDSPARSSLERVDRSARRLERLVRELLDVARLAAGRPRIEPENFDISALAAEVAQRWRASLREDSELALTTPGPVVGSWDRMRIEQVIENLISNAVKYGMGRSIEVVVETENEHVRLRVRDHGMGIPPEAQQKIFERFERLAAHRQYGGFGLGLWITKQAIEAHGGTIDVDSQPGQGSVFTVTLPMVAPGQDQQEPRRPSGAPGRSEVSLPS